MIIDFKPDGVIVSTGELTRMYTLREVGIYTKQVCGSVGTFRGSYHIKNLSTNKDEANKKAQVYSEATGLPMRSEADFDLEDIRRKSRAESAALRREQELFRVRKEQEQLQEYRQHITNGVLLMGKYVGLNAQETADRDEQYVRWLSREFVADGQHSPFNISAELCNNWVQENPEPTSEWVGSVGEKYKFTAKLVRKGWTHGMFQSMMFKFLTTEGNIIVVFSTAKKMVDLDAGKTYTVEGLVKKHEHSYYEPEDNNCVTIISRAKPV